MVRFGMVAWVEQQRPVTRIALLIVAIILALLVAGIFAGFMIASLEHGHLLPRKPRGWAFLTIAAASGYALYRAIRLLLRPSLSAGLSPFEQRYSKMWLIVMSLGLPIGIGLAMLSRRGNRRDSLTRIFIDGTLPAGGAVLLAATVMVVLGVGAMLYHRAIDDHEERAYLWGSQIAYYFLAAAIPVYWLLDRGGLVPTITAGGAMLMLLASLVIQGAVWAWFKFR